MRTRGHDDTMTRRHDETRTRGHNDTTTRRREDTRTRGNANLASNRDYNLGAIIRICMGINKVLLLLNEHGDPSFLFPNLSSYNINNQQAKFHKILSAGSISLE